VLLAFQVTARAEAFWQLTELLVRHEVAEEVVVYPALRKLTGGKGSQMRVSLNNRKLSTPCPC
jgi:hemerythrin superfamily protein